MDKESGRHRGFGFVNYEDLESVEKVLRSQPHVMDGQTVSLYHLCLAQWKRTDDGDGDDSWKSSVRKRRVRTCDRTTTKTTTSHTNLNRTTTTTTITTTTTTTKEEEEEDLTNSTQQRWPSSSNKWDGDLGTL
jgi:RNA recognition motif-containing protein